MVKYPLVLLALTFACVIGCGDSQSEPTSQELKKSESAAESATITDDEIRKAIAKHNREAAESTPTEPVIEFPDLSGWARSDRRPLPSKDCGFTIAFDHEDGLTVTLYQFTRGLKDILDDLTSDPIQNEMRHAKSGIEQAVELGYWKSAEETDQGIVSLGDSKQQALWSRYSITSNGRSVSSDIYLWSHQKTMFKLRCTGLFDKSEAESKVLTEFLTALGNSCSIPSD